MEKSDRAQTLLSLIVGAGGGRHIHHRVSFQPAAAVSMKPLGDAFIRLISMVIAVVVFCTVVSGIAGMGDIRRGRSSWRQSTFCTSRSCPTSPCSWA